MTWFRGDYDNYDQAAADRAPTSDIPRRERHEHIHCRIQTVPGIKQDGVLFATYYYDGNPDIVYRRRLYTLSHVGDDAKTLEMQIYKMAFIHGLRVARANCDFSQVDMGDLDDTELYEHLDGAQIMWRFEEGAHEGDGFVENGAHFVGTMRDGGYTASDKLRYEDELVLTKEDLWVGERVYNADGVMVGGNKEGIAHKMRRVRHNDEELKWTLNRDLADVNVV